MSLPLEYTIMNPLTGDKPVVLIVVACMAALAVLIFLFATKKKK